MKVFKKGIRLRLKRYISFMLCVIITCLSLLSSSTTAYAAEADQAEGIGTSLYEVSTALTAYANDVVGPNTNDKHNDHKLKEMESMANAGAFVGYGDEKNGFHAFIASNTAKSVTTSSYDAWTNVGDGGYTYAYVRYGRLLNDLGLDDTASNTSGSGGRGITGVLTQAVYGLASFVPKIFGFVMDLLEMLNPFKLFSGVFDIGTGVDKVTVTDPDSDEVTTFEGFEVKTTKDVGATNTAWKKVVKYVSDLYTTVQGIGFLILPLFLAFLIASFLLLKTANKSRKALAFFYRVVFITAGIPLLGFFYTAMLSNVGKVTSNEPAATQVVGQTYIDFQKWVTDSRLALPSGVILTSAGTGVDEDGNVIGGLASGFAHDDNVRSARQIVWKLNNKMGIVKGSYNGGYLGEHDNGYNDTAGLWDSNGKLSGIRDEEGRLIDDNHKKLIKDNINALLSRYQSGDFYQASAFETAVNGTFNQAHKDDLGSTPGTGNAVSNEDKIYGMYGDTNDSQSWLDREVADNKAIFNGGPVTTDLKWTNKNWNIYANGNLQVIGELEPKGDIKYRSGNWAGDGKAVDAAKKGGLSTVAMYNYLSTAFSDSSVQVYSAVNSTSEYVKQSHYSVNLIGSDMLRVAYGANVLVVMGVIVIITFVYAIGMIISNIKRMLHMLMTIPAAMLGVLNSIVQVVVYVIMMVVELVATVFVYEFVCDLVVMFGSILESPIEEMVESTSVIGGRFAFTNMISANSLYHNTSFFVFGMFVLLFVLVGLGIAAKRYSKSILYVWEYAWCKVYRFVTCEKLVPEFDAWMCERDSLYVWDEVNSSVSCRFERVKQLVSDVLYYDIKSRKGVEIA